MQSAVVVQRHQARDHVQPELGHLLLGHRSPAIEVILEVAAIEPLGDDIGAALPLAAGQHGREVGMPGGRAARTLRDAALAGLLFVLGAVEHLQRHDAVGCAFSTVDAGHAATPHALEQRVTLELEATRELLGPRGAHVAKGSWTPVQHGKQKLT